MQCTEGTRQNIVGASFLADESIIEVVLPLDDVRIISIAIVLVLCPLCRPATPRTGCVFGTVGLFGVDELFFVICGCAMGFLVLRALLSPCVDAELAVRDIMPT